MPKIKTAHRLYTSRQWILFARSYLNDNPLCARCQLYDRVTMAEACDHIIPHKGNDEAFMLPYEEGHEAVQGLCNHCHRHKSHRESNGDYDNFKINESINIYSRIKNNIN